MSQFHSLSRFAWPMVVALAVLLLGQTAFDRFTPVANSAPPERKEFSEADHARHEAALMKALAGQVDVFMDISQLEGGTPTLADLHFVDIVDVTGKELLRFGDSKKHYWLVDPDMVLSFRMKAK